MTGESRTMRWGAPLVFLLIALVAFWIYWPGHAGPALLDDRVVLGPLSELAESPSLAWDFIFRETSGSLGRSVSMVTFVAEKALLGDDIAITKTLNIFLHLANGALVTWLLCLLFRAAGVRESYSLALLLGALWLVTPLFVSTVLYGVQRMAMLSTTFMLAACVSYAIWRRGLALGQPRHRHLACMLVLVVLGLLAKENTIVVIPVILLLEACWYQFRDARGNSLPGLRLVVSGLIGLGAAGLLLALIVLYQDLAAAFSRRPFSMEERVMTQLPILWDYLGQLLWPDIARMGIYHDDYPISRSLTQHGTAAALLGWVAVLALVVYAFRWEWGRRLALGPLWFLAGHSIEASVFSLELYFEHRNYFPAVGLLLSMGGGMAIILRRWPELQRPLMAWGAVCGLTLAMLTSSQVQIWSSRPLLTFNHYNAHPHSYRATSDLALLMANSGNLELARHYSRQAFEAAPHERSSDLLVRDLTLHCVVNESAPTVMLEELGVAHPQRPFRSPANLLYLVRLLEEDECPAFNAQALADRLWQIFGVEGSVATAHYSLFYGLATLENALQRYARALAYTERYLNQRRGNIDGLFMKLHFSTALRDHQVRQETLDTLLQLERDGKLSVRQRQTLALYMEN